MVDDDVEEVLARHARTADTPGARLPRTARRARRSTRDGDPRLHLRPRTYRGRTIVPLTRYPGGLQAYKQIFPGSTAERDPEPLRHEGYVWFCVLSGRLRLILGDQDVVLGAGEIAEFDTHVPHWMGSADGNPVEILNLFGPQGERTHTTATGRPSVPTGDPTLA